MADQIIKDRRLVIGAYDLSACLKEFDLILKKEQKDNTCFLAEARSGKHGLASAEASFSGFLNDSAGLTPSFIEGTWGDEDAVMTACPHGAAVGAVAYILKSCMAEASLDQAVGEMSAVSGAAYGNAQIALPGNVLASGEKTATGNEDAVELGAVATGKYLYAALHVTSLEGTDTPTITVKIQSDSSESFDSPTDRISFTAKTAVGEQWATPVAGEITDTWWRAVITISGTNPAFDVYCSMAIQ